MISKFRNATKTSLLALAIAAVAGAASTPLYAQNTEIVVTARKTSENIQDVPISITAVTAEEFENAGLQEFTDLANVTPNFNVVANGAGGSLFAGLTIRGQTAGFLTLNADQAVGVSINGAPVTRGTGLFSNLFDIERVEVLKGPQGTLYGKNTTGGQVNVITKAPEFNDLGGYVKFTLGNYNRTDAEMVVNLPLVDDTLAVRLGGALTHRDGFGSGTGGLGAPAGRELADDNELFLRGSLLFEPNDALTIRINADYHEQDESTAINRSLRSAFLDIGLPFLIPIALETISDDFYVGNDFRASAPFVRTEDWGVNATADLDLGGATLTSITSYRKQDAETSLQAAPGTEVFLGQNSEFFSQELRLNGAALDDRLNWQVGGFYSHETGEDIDNLPGNFQFQTTAAKNKSWSLFAQPSFAISDQLTLTVGLRYTNEDRQVTDVSPVVTGQLQNSASFDAISWMASLDFKPTDETLLYVSASRGFRSGAIDQDTISQIVDPEFVLNYEAGFKADLLDNRLRVNASGFYSDYKDIQRVVFDFDNFPATILRNAAQAKLWGFELEVNATPIDGLTLSATVGHTRGRFDEFMDGAIDRSDDPIGGPKWQYSLSGRYEFDVSERAKIGIQANYFWIDENLLTGPATIAALPDGQGSIGAYGLLNGQVDLDLDVLKGLNIAIFGTNILDKEYAIGGIVVPVGGVTVSNRFLGNPQTWGIRMKKSF